MNDIRKQIENYIPYNNQEIKDQKMVLKYMDLFEDVLTRDNEIVHFTCSAFVLNEKRDKVLMVHHNIYHSWSWLGGHADGERDFLKVAIKEIEEESGVRNVTPLSTDIFSLDILSVVGHDKHGRYIPPHIHISVAYLLEASEGEVLHIKEDENSNVAWLPLKDYSHFITEEHMKPIYQKVICKAIENHYIEVK